MTISAYPWPFQQLFSRTVRNYAMINTIISFPVQKNSLFMKIFRCIRIELMPHIYDTKTLTMVVEAQQSVNLFEDKKRTTWTGCWQKRGRVELGHRRFLLPKVFCRKCIAPLRNTHLFGPVSGIFVLKGYFQGMKYKQGVPKNKYFSECCWSHGAQAQSLVASTPVSENCFFGSFLPRLSGINRSQVIWMGKFGPTALNFASGYFFWKVKDCWKFSRYGRILFAATFFCHFPKEKSYIEK